MGTGSPNYFAPSPSSPSLRHLQEAFYWSLYREGTWVPAQLWLIQGHLAHEGQAMEPERPHPAPSVLVCLISFCSSVPFWVFNFYPWFSTFAPTKKKKRLNCSPSVHMHSPCASSHVGHQEQLRTKQLQSCREPLCSSKSTWSFYLKSARRCQNRCFSGYN